MGFYMEQGTQGECHTVTSNSPKVQSGIDGRVQVQRTTRSRLGVSSVSSPERSDCSKEVAGGTTVAGERLQPVASMAVFFYKYGFKKKLFAVSNHLFISSYSFKSVISWMCCTLQVPQPRESPKELWVIGSNSTVRMSQTKFQSLLF